VCPPNAKSDFAKISGWFSKSIQFQYMTFFLEKGPAMMLPSNFSRWLNEICNCKLLPQIIKKMSLYSVPTAALEGK